ncbi:RluA family pseudouridine synthase [Bombilactobacillus bombi]|uniref:RluA family pseudouridine synthase n=1 Tax=Bombilactobacillus bombi TaxID=1303590 RepID=UPI0015E5C3DB|nr:RluA family pseudouridine synthase [Bombilactobacillus bombi]MBA1434589.1 RluA family pseudouridine synthase [Bombilactobacillus bombi]
MILERHFKIQSFAEPLSIRTALKTWLIPRKWQHELRIQRGFLVNGSYKPFNNLINNGDNIDLFFDTTIKSQNYLPAEHIGFHIQYENQDLLIINKPAGLKTHPNQPQETQTLFNQVRTYLQYNPLMIHRLDKMTSGLIMVGKNPLVVPIFNRQLSQKIMQRTYIAVTVYNPKIDKQGCITANIGLDPSDPRKRKITVQGQFAQTKYQIIQHNYKYALVKLALLTGRTHQIRVHLQSLKMPIVGDPLYGPSATSMYLHAYQLGYQLPFSTQQKNIAIAIPHNFYQLTSI